MAFFAVLFILLGVILLGVSLFLVGQYGITMNLYNLVISAVFTIGGSAVIAGMKVFSVRRSRGQVLSYIAVFFLIWIVEVGLLLWGMSNKEMLVKTPVDENYLCLGGCLLLAIGVLFALAGMLKMMLKTQKQEPKNTKG